MSNINNPKKVVPTGINLNDLDYTNILITLIKDCEKNLCIAMTEASNEKLYKDIKKMIDDISALQREIYELMFKNGWYQLEEVSTTKIKNLLNTLNTNLDNLAK